MMSYFKNLVDFCYRWGRTGRWLCGVRTALLALGVLGIVLPTVVSAADLVSVNVSGTNSGNGYSWSPQISADGRFVVFESDASDLTATDTNGTYDVFVRDLVSNTTILISVNSAGTNSGNDSSGSPQISANGRFVAFTSAASDLTATDTNGTVDVFVRDLVSTTTTLISVNHAGTDSGNDYSGYPQISADGRFVAFEGDASDLTATDTNGTYDVFVRDLVGNTTTLISVNSAGTDSGNDLSEFPQISADGRFVAFVSYASDLTATDTNGNNVFVRDLVSNTTTLISVNSAGTDSSNVFSWWCPQISADGRFVVFESDASDLTATDTNGTYDVFVRDLVSNTTTLISANSAETDSGNDYSGSPQISADGRFVAFTSAASDLTATDTNGTYDVFVRDLVGNTTTLISVNSAGTDSGNNSSWSPQISADGRFVAFESDASDLTVTDTNGKMDIFVRDLVSNTTTLISANSAETNSGNDSSGSPQISADGRFVAFLSIASDLTATDTNGKTDIFVYRTPTICDCTAPLAIKGTAGTDILFGTRGADIICGLGGNDAIAGLGGDDCIDGGEGNDLISGGLGDDILVGGDGNDVLFGIFGDDTMDGGKGYDWLFGGQGTDICIGEVIKGCQN